MAAIIVSLIYVCIFVGVVYLILWVLEQIGVALPPMVVKILWVIVALCVLLWLVQSFLPTLAGGHLPGLR